MVQHEVVYYALQHLHWGHRSFRILFEQTRALLQQFLVPGQACSSTSGYPLLRSTASSSIKMLFYNMVHIVKPGIKVKSISLCEHTFKQTVHNGNQLHVLPVQIRVAGSILAVP